MAERTTQCACPRPSACVSRSAAEATSPARSECRRTKEWGSRWSRRGPSSERARDSRGSTTGQPSWEMGSPCSRPAAVSWARPEYSRSLASSSAMEADWRLSRGRMVGGAGGAALHTGRRFPGALTRPTLRWLTRACATHRAMAAYASHRRATRSRSGCRWTWCEATSIAWVRAKSTPSIGSVSSSRTSRCSPLLDSPGRPSRVAASVARASSMGRCTCVCRAVVTVHTSCVAASRARSASSSATSASAWYTRAMSFRTGR